MSEPISIVFDEKVIYINKPNNFEEFLKEFQAKYNIENFDIKNFNIIVTILFNDDSKKEYKIKNQNDYNNYILSNYSILYIKFELKNAKPKSIKSEKSVSIFNESIKNYPDEPFYFIDLDEKEKQFLLMFNTPFNLLSLSVDYKLIIKEYKDIVNEFQCYICGNIPINPIKCEKCETIFCKNHIDEITNPVKKCKSCKEKLVMINFTTLEINILKKLKFHCFNNECNIILPIRKYLKHCKLCDKSTYKCKFCDFSGDKKKCENHSNSCGLVIQNCTFCNKKMPKYICLSHILTCKNEIITVQCEWCGKTIKKYEMDQHLLFCPKKK